MARRDILNTLKTEHDLLRDLFAEMEATTDRAVKRRADLLLEIKQNLLPHAKWEEQVFYPAFEARANRDGLKTHAEAVQEHRAVEQTVLPDVHAVDFGTPQFAGRTKVFGEMIDHHATEEETTMFKMARKLFSAQERAELDADYEEWKASPAASAAIAAAETKTGVKAVARRLAR